MTARPHVQTTENRTSWNKSQAAKLWQRRVCQTTLQATCRLTFLTGPQFYVAAAISFFKGLQVYPNPQVRTNDDLAE